jgi:formiminotetrahydrofolate cyclodeaminase
MNESPNEFFARLIAHNQVVKNIEEEAARKEAMRKAGVEAIERARTFA